jgi:hypothetical protein
MFQNSLLLFLILYRVVRIGLCFDVMHFASEQSINQHYDVGVWQVPRAAAALVLTPIVDTILVWLQSVFGVNQHKAFVIAVTFCLAIAGAIFGLLIVATV